MSAILSRPMGKEAGLSPVDQLRRQLETPGFLARLANIVRRRVPASDVDDVVQSVVCDALGSAFIPIDDGEITCWIFGIARNKVADVHRRAKREASAPDEPAGGARIGEHRILLRSVALDAISTERGREAFDWIVREHDGDELARIAEETRVPAPVVRQRVSRLRRALRTRWLGVGGILVALLGVGYSARSYFSAPEIVADTAGSPQAAAFLTGIDGDWTVADPNATDLAKDATVHIRGARLVVAVGGFDHTRTIVLDHIDSNRALGRIEGDGETHNVTAQLTDGILTVTEGPRILHLTR
ncbi:MAG: hypothetical protein ABI551_01385 [Polyangiaceae bacterium]